MKPALLLVDDEKSICSALKRTFDRREYDVYEANNGMIALDILNRHPVDIIISDQRMPGMKGTELLQIARERHPETSRIILSGQSDYNDMADAINKAKVHQFIAKPWDDSELLHTIHQVIAESNTVTAMPRPKPQVPAPAPHKASSNIYFELEQAIKNDELLITSEPYSHIASTGEDLKHLCIRWANYPRLHHQGIISLAQQSGYLGELYQWYLLKLLAHFRCEASGDTFIIDVFCGPLLGNRPLRQLIERVLLSDHQLIFRVPFTALQQASFNEILQAIYFHNNQLWLNLDKRVINIESLANTQVSYVEMDARHTLINNSALTEKRLGMIRDAKNLGIKTILTGVQDDSQRHYAKAMSVDLYSNF